MPIYIMCVLTYDFDFLNANVADKIVISKSHSIKRDCKLAVPLLIHNEYPAKSVRYLVLNK